MDKIKPNYKVDRYINFGRYKLNKFQLEHNNYLLIKTKNFSPVYNFKSKKIIVSDELKDLILKIIDENIINIELQNNLNIDELKILEKLLKCSLLTSKLKFKFINNELNNLIDKFKKVQNKVKDNMEYEKEINFGLPYNKDEMNEVINLLFNYNIFNENIKNDFIEVIEECYI
jgi:hypothetical protein